MTYFAHEKLFLLSALLFYYFNDFYLSEFCTSWDNSDSLPHEWSASAVFHMTCVGVGLCSKSVSYLIKRVGESNPAPSLI